MPSFTQNCMYVYIGVRVLLGLLKWSLVKHCVDKSKKLQLDLLLTSFEYFFDPVTVFPIALVLILPYYPLIGIGAIVMVAQISCWPLSICLVFGFAAFNVSRKREILDLDLVASRRFCPLPEVLLGLSLCIFSCLLVILSLFANRQYHDWKIIVRFLIIQHLCLNECKHIECKQACLNMRLINGV